APPTLDVSLTNRAAPTDHYPLSLHDALPICGKRGRNEQEAPSTAELDHEHVPERDRDEEPRGPEEIEEDHVSPAVLRRQVFRRDRRIDDKEATEADARKHPQEEQAGDVEGEGRQGCES